MHSVPQFGLLTNSEFSPDQHRDQHGIGFHWPIRKAARNHEITVNSTFASTGCTFQQTQKTNAFYAQQDSMVAMLYIRYRR